MIPKFQQVGVTKVSLKSLNGNMEQVRHDWITLSKYIMYKCWKQMTEKNYNSKYERSIKSNVRLLFFVVSTA